MEIHTVLLSLSQLAIIEYLLKKYFPRSAGLH